MALGAVRHRFEIRIAADGLEFTRHTAPAA